MLTSSKQLELSYHGNQSFPTFLFSTELQVKLICRGTGPTYSSCTLFTFGKTVLTNLSAVVLRCRMFRRISTESLCVFFCFFFSTNSELSLLKTREGGSTHSRFHVCHLHKHCTGFCSYEGSSAFVMSRKYLHLIGSTPGVYSFVRTLLLDVQFLGFNTSFCSKCY